jgi:hypothetical protein
MDWLEVLPEGLLEELMVLLEPPSTIRPESLASRQVPLGAGMALAD